MSCYINIDVHSPIPFACAAGKARNLPQSMDWFSDATVLIKSSNGQALVLLPVTVALLAATGFVFRLTAVPNAKLLTFAGIISPKLRPFCSRPLPQPTSLGSQGEVQAHPEHGTLTLSQGSAVA